MSRLYPERPFVGVGCVVWRGARVLLIRRAGRAGWSLPGGTQELGETVAATAAREVREETGIEIALGALLDVVDLIEPDGARVRTHYTLVDFEAEWAGGAVQAASDAVAAGWFDLAEADRLEMWEETRRVVRLSAARRGLA